MLNVLTLNVPASLVSADSVLQAEREREREREDKQTDKERNREKAKRDIKIARLTEL
jgi:hypothetical protein